MPAPANRILLTEVRENPALRSLREVPPEDFAIIFTPEQIAKLDLGEKLETRHLRFTDILAFHDAHAGPMRRQCDQVSS